MSSPNFASLCRFQCTSRPGGVDCLFGDQNCRKEAHDGGEGDLEPTPIAQNGVVVVRKFPVTAASWHHDRAFLDSLKSVLREEPSGVASPEHMGSHRTLFCNKMLASSLSFKVANDNIATTSTGQSSESSISGADSSMSLDSTCSDKEEDVESIGSSSSSFRSTFVEQWNTRYSELQSFKNQNGHCLVPLSWKVNPSLAHWVKRQRYQFRVKMEGKRSTLTDERQRQLESLGFVWDSHAAGWEERWNELREFRERFGHCSVPKNYPENPQLAIWVKCQRRQHKLLRGGQRSNMTRSRMEKLQLLGFTFEPRSGRRRTRIHPKC